MLFCFVGNPNKNKLFHYLIGCVVCSYNLNKGNRKWVKLYVLPGLAALLISINDFSPVLLVSRYFNVITVRPVITIPQQQPIKDMYNEFKKFQKKSEKIGKKHVHVQCTCTYHIAGNFGGI